MLESSNSRRILVPCCARTEHSIPSLFLLVCGLSVVDPDRWPCAPWRPRDRGGLGSARRRRSSQLLPSFSSAPPLSSLPTPPWPSRRRRPAPAPPTASRPRPREARSCATISRWASPRGPRTATVRIVLFWFSACCPSLPTREGERETRVHFFHFFFFADLFFFHRKNPKNLENKKIKKKSAMSTRSTANSEGPRSRSTGETSCTSRWSTRFPQTTRR